MGIDPPRPDVLTPSGPCRWCGEDHGAPLCPFVKAFEFDETGTIVRRVEYLTQADFEHRPKPADEPEVPYQTLRGKT